MEMGGEIFGNLQTGGPLQSAAKEYVIVFPESPPFHLIITQFISLLFVIYNFCLILLRYFIFSLFSSWTYFSNVIFVGGHLLCLDFYLFIADYNSKISLSKKCINQILMF